MKGNLKENLGIDVESQNLQEKNLDVELDGYTFEITKEGEVKDKGTVIPTPPVENKIKPGEKVTEEQGNTPYTKNGTAVIPVGFAIVPGCDDVSKGLVISDKENDAEDEGNQFVWIPVTKASGYEINENYIPSALTNKIIPDKDYLPTEIEVPNEKTEQQVETDLVTTDLVKKYGVGGFYISRYEAGQESSDTLVSKKGANVWNSITQETARETAKTFVVEDNTKVKSGLCTGIQWDIVMAFVNGKNDGEGNPYLVETCSSSRHHDSGVEQSGQNLADKVCNIYDLEGNCIEYIAEKNTYDAEYPYMRRGGNYNTDNTASLRSGAAGVASIGFSFRFVLYVM